MVPIIGKIIGFWLSTLVRRAPVALCEMTYNTMSSDEKEEDHVGQEQASASARAPLKQRRRLGPRSGSAAQVARA